MVVDGKASQFLLLIKYNQSDHIVDSDEPIKSCGRVKYRASCGEKSNQFLLLVNRYLIRSHC
jgi:hypothetical protein